MNKMCSSSRTSHAIFNFHYRSSSLYIGFRLELYRLHPNWVNANDPEDISPLYIHLEGSESSSNYCMVPRSHYVRDILST